MKSSKIYTSLLAAACFASTAIAQPKPVGADVPDMTLTDIAGNSFKLYDYLDEGYTVVIDISATWCGPCWSFHESHTLQKLYEKYGPEGTVEAKKIMPIFIEGDPDTNGADLEGTGTSTIGNWTEGSDYHIVDVASMSTYLGALYLPTTTGIAFPTFFVICPDRKIKFSQEGTGSATTEGGFVTMAEGCNTTSINNIVDEHSVSIYPNPATDNIQLAYVANSSSKADITVASITGQVVYSESFNMTAGQQLRSVDISSLAAGMYVVTLSTESGDVIRKKIAKK